MADAARTVMFLHALGADPSSWDAQLTSLPLGFTGFTPPISGITGAGRTGFRFTDAADDLVAELDRRGLRRVHVCGLSLGAMVATRLALDHPDRVASLVLSASQVRPNQVAMTVQRAAIRVLPRSVVAGMGLTRPDWLAVQRSIAAIDDVARLGEIEVPTLVLCGSRDRANLTAARRIAAGVPDAELQVVRGAGHLWNTDMPDRFSTTIGAFYRRIERDDDVAR